MNPEYQSYLLSEQWDAKRRQRLAISFNRCAVCPKTRGIQVHHLTYERVFNEEMGDLLPLCDEHHNQIEEMISKGHLTRNGNPLHLATETVRILMQIRKPLRPPPVQNPPKKGKRKKNKWKPKQKQLKTRLVTLNMSESERHKAVFDRQEKMITKGWYPDPF